jgi:PAS domain S-box-containing protein
MNGIVTANLRHALRTPLNHIVGYAEILREDLRDGSDEIAPAALEEILGAARRILEGVRSMVPESGEGGAAVDDLRDAMAPQVAVIQKAIMRLSALRRDAEVSRMATAARALESFARGGEIEETSSASAPSATALPTPWIGARVLAVDDDEENRVILQRLLEPEGFSVNCATGGAEALRMMEAASYDLVLLDLVMPDVDGYEVLASMQKSPALRSVPVIVLSASDDLSHVVQSLDHGAEDFISKPFDPVLLRVRITASLRRRKAEDDAVRLAEGFRLLLDSSGEGIYGVDTAGRCTFINRSALQMLGYEQSELVGRRLHGLIHHTRADGQPYMAIECPVHSVMRTGLPRRATDELLYRADGSAIPVEYSAHPILKDGAVQGGVVTFMDISDRKRTEERLRESAKLESLGVLAGGIAHDFNNLLTGIMGNASLVLDGMDASDRNAHLLEEVVRASDRAAELTRQLLAYAGKGRYMPTLLDLSTVLREMSDLLRTSVPKKVRLELELESGLGQVEADLSQMQQLVLNLTINAGEAIGNREGRVIIRTRSVNVRPGEVSEPGFEPLSPGDYVALEVQDTGVGIDAATRSRIFDPFFTTKFVGRGLGLPASMGIVRSHHGVMRVETEPGRGSRFEVLLPVSRAYATSQ